MTRATFDEQLAAARRHLEALCETAGSVGNGDPLLQTALTELGNALEELHVTAEELRAQSDELAASRDAIDAQHQRYEDLFESAPDGYLVTDAHGTIEEANRVAATLLRRDCSLLAGKPLALFVAEEQRRNFRTHLSRLQEGRADRLVDWEVCLQRHDGTTVDVGLTAAVVRGPKRKVTGLRWLLRDISERKRHDAALRDSEARLRAIVETATDGIITIDEQGTVLSFNAAAARMFGYAVEEVIGQPVTLLMPPEYRDHHDDYIAAYLRTGERKVIGIGREVPGQRKDGTIFPLDLAVSEVRLGDRRMFTGIVHDITARKATREALRQERDFAESLVETAQVIVLVLDTEGRIVRFNSFMEEISGYGLPEVQGRDWFTTFVPERDRHHIRTLFSRAVSDVAVRGNVNPLVTKSGAEREIEWYSKTLKNAQGAVIGLLSVGLDITERRLAEAAVRELQKAAQQRERLADIGAITAQIVHDLGNPLSGISMQAQLILRRAARDETQAVRTVVKPVQRILAEVHRLDALSKEFMEFSREQRLDVKQVYLPRLLHEVIELWEPVAAARAIALTLEVLHDLPAVAADAEKLRRVFDNLIKNAIEAIDTGPGRIAIQIVQPASATVRVNVTDTGPGISDTVEVFRLFETTKTYGSGIGLAVAKQIVLAHRGTIEVARIEPHGTVFRIELPCDGPI
jgi:two-component system sensor kinase FixL